MPGGIEGGADRRQVEHDPGGGFVVHHAHGAQLVAGIVAQRGGQVGQLHPGAPVGRQVLHRKPELAGHFGPAIGEHAAFHHQDGIAGREQILQRGFPGAMARGVVHEQIVLRAEHALQPVEARVIDLEEGSVVVFDTGLLHGLQHGIGDVGRAWIGEELAAACVAFHVFLPSHIRPETHALGGKRHAIARLPWQHHPAPSRAVQGSPPHKLVHCFH